MKRLLPLLLMTISLSIHGQSLSPSVLSPAGGYSEQGNISLSYTLGELAVQTLSAGNLILTQGFHQPMDVNVSTEDLRELDWQVRTWPNPVLSALYLQIETERDLDILIELYDLSGRIHRQLKIESSHFPSPCRIEMSTVEKGLYILKIRSTDRQLLRIIKIQKQ